MLWSPNRTQPFSSSFRTSRKGKVIYRELEWVSKVPLQWIYKWSFLSEDISPHLITLSTHSFLLVWCFPQPLLIWSRCSNPSVTLNQFWTLIKRGFYYSLMSTFLSFPGKYHSFNKQWCNINTTHATGLVWACLWGPSTWSLSSKSSFRRKTIITPWEELVQSYKLRARHSGILRDTSSSEGHES